MTRTHYPPLPAERSPYEYLKQDHDKLLAACHALTRVHTSVHSFDDFTIRMGATNDIFSGVTDEQYVEAWRTLHEALGWRW